MAARCTTWMMYLLIVILGLMCNYVRRIGLFPITGYCSNTTSCTQNHCELKSNKVCHCYRGKLFFYFFLSPPQVCMLTFPGTLPVWMKCTVMYLWLTGNMWKIQDKCGSNSRTKIVFSWSVLHGALWFSKWTKLCCIASSEMYKKLKPKMPA